MQGDRLRRISEAFGRVKGHSEALTADFGIVSSIEGVYVARSAVGTPAFILPLDTAATDGVGRRSAGLELSPHERVSFVLDGKEATVPAAVVSCTDDSLLGAFSVLCADLVARVSAGERTWKTILQVFGEWQQLLAPVAKLSVEGELGLWGELWFILRSADTQTVLAAWRGPEGDSTDFWLGEVGVEVKTSRHRRKHFVSRAQVVEQPPQADAWFLSLWVRPEPVVGRTLVELVDDVLARVTDPIAAARKLASAGYRDVHRDAYAEKWDVVEVEWYAAADVPTIRHVDRGVSNIRYQVSLEGVPPAIDSVAAENWVRFSGAPHP